MKEITLNEVLEKGLLRMDIERSYKKHKWLNWFWKRK